MAELTAPAASGTGSKTPRRCVFRYTVPVTDTPWTFDLTSDPVHVDIGGAVDEVDFWAEYTEGAPRVARRFQVFGTGHPLPEGASRVGTCPRTRAGLVWHLYELAEVRDA